MIVLILVILLFSSVCYAQTNRDWMNINPKCEKNCVVIIDTRSKENKLMNVNSNCREDCKVIERDIEQDAKIEANLFKAPSKGIDTEKDKKIEKELWEKIWK